MLRYFRALLLMPLLAGCPELLSQAQERGPCTLDVVTERIIHYEAGGASDDMVKLEPPFVVILKRSIDFPPQAIVILEGDGWHYPGNVDQPDWPTATVTAPDGKLSVIPNALGETLLVEHIVDAPGVWTFTVEWELIDCLQTVSVRALPPQ